MLRFVVESEGKPVRLDRYLTERLPDQSRAKIQSWIRDGRVLVGGEPAAGAMKLSGGETLEVDPAPARDLAARPEDIPLDVLYEDAYLVAVNKPSGMTVHLGAGEQAQSGTLVNALLHRFEKLSEQGGEDRPGIVHRLDRLTSGVILVAKDDRTHRLLSGMFERREIKKTYQALVHGEVGDETELPPNRKGRPQWVDGAPWIRIEAPIGRDRRSRHRMTVTSAGRGALTDYRALARQPRFSRLEVRIHTGRTHQIRVHLAWAGHALIGDSTYGAPKKVEGLPTLERFYLHAEKLKLEHPVTGEMLRLAAPIPDDFEALARCLALSAAL